MSYAGFHVGPANLIAVTVADVEAVATDAGPPRHDHRGRARHALSIQVDEGGRTKIANSATSRHDSLDAPALGSRCWSVVPPGVPRRNIPGSATTLMRDRGVRPRNDW